ncbi:hypothetical protein LCGC14_1246980 [marine sediment metagenome]|uniref:Uncharacterized protein n=1 Tax=marine sediment metagenome TaxID=412755 RepID=A0A0F9L815_9ZZZZ
MLISSPISIEPPKHLDDQVNDSGPDYYHMHPAVYGNIPRFGCANYVDP